jgi:membrane protease YdiL (CAAX protease family)
MVAPEPDRGLLKPGPEWLLAAATGLLVVFHYAARADTVGVLGAGRAWSPLTRSPLQPGTHFALAGVLLGVCPVLLARFAGGVPLARLGLGPGRPARGLAWLGVGVPLAVLAGYIGAGSASVRQVYPLDGTLTSAPSAFVPHALLQFLYFGAWEVLFRGVLLFGLRDRLGSGPSNLVQTALSVVAHFGRAWDETIAALPAGLLFGWVDLRVGSVWYVAVVHWVVGVSLDWFILTR